MGKPEFYLRTVFLENLLHFLLFFKATYRLVTFLIEIPLMTNLTYLQTKLNEQITRFLGIAIVFFRLLL